MWQVGAIMVLAMTLIVGGDVAAKVLSQDGVSPIFVAWTRFAIACLVLLPLSGVSRSDASALRDPRVWLRALLIMAGICCILTALRTEPVANTFWGECRHGFCPSGRRFPWLLCCSDAVDCAALSPAILADFATGAGRFDLGPIWIGRFARDHHMGWCRLAFDQRYGVGLWQSFVGLSQQNNAIQRDCATDLHPIVVCNSAGLSRLFGLARHVCLPRFGCDFREWGRLARSSAPLKHPIGHLVGRVAKPLQSRRSVPCEFLHHDLAPRRRKFGFRPHAHDLCVIGIREDQTCLIGEQFRREIPIHSPEKPVTPLQIALPFVVGLKVRPRGFAFNHPNVAFGSKCHNIHAQPPCGHQFFNAHEVQRAQMAAHPTRQQLAGLKRRQIRLDCGIGHPANMNNM